MAKKTQSKYSNSQIRVLAAHLVDYERAGNDEDARRTVVEAALSDLEGSREPPPQGTKTERLAVRYNVCDRRHLLTELSTGHWELAEATRGRC